MECPHDWRQVNTGEDGGKGGVLSNTHIAREGVREFCIPEESSKASNQIIGEELHNRVCKAHPVEHEGESTMVQG